MSGPKRTQEPILEDTLTHFRELREKDPMAASIYFRVNSRDIQARMRDEEREHSAIAKSAILARLTEIEARGYKELAHYERLRATAPHRASTYLLLHRTAINMQRVEFEESESAADDQNGGPEAA